MTPELSAYLRRCRNPMFAASALTLLARRAIWSARARLAPASRFRYPPAIARARNAMVATRTAPAPRPAVHPPATTLTLTGAAHAVRASEDWDVTFEDDETTLSLHRWNWLLRGITDDAERLTREHGLALMRSWLAHEGVAHATHGDAYSTGERIANGMLFLLLTGDGTIPAELLPDFRAMACDVAEHLEYLRSGETGNHAFNNARALLFVGLLADLPEAVALAHEVIRERLPAVIDGDGFMNEGSSHYHLLFTRWVLEMLWLARRAGDAEGAALLQAPAAQLVRRCWFFLVRDQLHGTWRMPLLGDVSPDFPPEWLIGLPWSRLALESWTPASLPAGPVAPGWGALFGAVSGSGDHAPVSEHHALGGWHRIERHGWSLFARARSSDGRLRASHEHLDLGGIVLFRRGAPVLVDCGRRDYTASPMGRYGWSAASHTTLLVDDRPSTSDGPTWMTHTFRGVRVTVRWREYGDDDVLSVTHDGFARLASGVGVHERAVTVSPAGVRIEDRLAGTGEHEIRLRVHFAPGVARDGAGTGAWKAGATAGIFQNDAGWRTEIQEGRATPPIGGVVFPAYGREEASRTLDLSSRASLPLTVCHHILETS
jgi:hypothetical protein